MELKELTFVPYNDFITSVRCGDFEIGTIHTYDEFATGKKYLQVTPVGIPKSVYNPVTGQTIPVSISTKCKDMEQAKQVAIMMFVNYINFFTK